MNALLKKLNYKDHSAVLCLNAPDSFVEVFDGLPQTVRVSFECTSGRKEIVDFATVFVTELAEIERAIASIDPLVEGDITLWFCYPKKSSKKYTCNFNRDSGWDALGALNYEPVRQVAIDEDWSALRFRKTTFIAQLTRRADYAISKVGKQRTTGK
jgi:hypothetical protein